MSTGGKKAGAKRTSSKKKLIGATEPTLTKKQEEQVEKLFETHCEDQRYGLTAGELSQIRQVLGFDNDLQACSAALDMFKPKGMNEEYLKKHIAKLFAEMNARNELTKVFKLFDKKGAGRITKRSLRETVSDLGEKMSDDAMSEMLLVADREKKGHVTLEDFIALMSESWMAR